MRTIKFLGFAVALAAVAVPLKAQTVDIQPGAFPAIDRLARQQAHRVERWQQMQQVRQFRAKRAGQFAMAGRFANGRGMNAAMARGAGRRGMGMQGAQLRGMQAARFGGRAGFRAGSQAGLRAGARAGFRAGRGAGFHKGLQAGRGAGFQKGLQTGRGAGFRAGLNATPEQKALAEQFQKQRQGIREQVQAGKLTREQARAEMQKWRAEHLPKK